MLLTVTNRQRVLKALFGALFAAICLYITRRWKQSRRSADRAMVVALDFDNTITSIHVSGVPHFENLATSAAEVQMLVRDAAFLVSFCKDMAARGNTMCIASFARDAVVVKGFLKHIFAPEDYRDFLPDERLVCWCPEGVASPTDTKAAHLMQIAELTGVAHHRVVLVDDNRHNVETARTAGFQAFCCDDLGFSREFLESTPEFHEMVYF